ncbi:MAG: hypothetical protein HYV28_04685 [Ignavibacteriales bacterium]|nr:hypothetical protein [Ignavibacteriales bacterium]
MKLIIALLLALSTTGILVAQAADSISEKKSVSELLQDVKQPSPLGQNTQEWTIRKMRAAVLSGLMPGTGQTYLGQEYKGVGLTIGFAGAALAALLNHNNFTTREDRISNLFEDYEASSSYSGAEAIWQTIEQEKVSRDKDYSRRKYFSYAAIAIWVYNMVDIIYLTEDSGVEQFSFNTNPVHSNSGNPFASNQLLSFRINLF